MVDLICFPGAGAGASVFRPWVNRLPAFAAVLACQLPGREGRIDEAPARSLTEAADGLAAAYLAIRPVERPFVLFGHSMGGTLAFEVALRLAAAGRAASTLILSASSPPKVGNRNTSINDDSLRELLLGYDPENRRIIGNDELYAVLASVIGNDIAMLRRHEIASNSVCLNVSAHLMSGIDDLIVPADLVARWAEFFTGPTTHREIDGGHFFPFREGRDRVLSVIATILREIVARRVRK